MARLPIPGSDNQQWGNILNDYLSVAHDAGGTIKNGVIGNDQITDVSQTKVTGLSATLSNKANNSDVVHLTGDESISGIKTFAGTINVPAPTTDTNAATKLYVDSLLPASLVFNVKDYGAVGDGTTDDQTAIQDTIDAAEAAGGGIVFIPQGTYIVSGTPQITTGNIIVAGTGSGSKILLASAALNGAGTTIGLWINGGSNVLIHNLCVDGNFDNIAKNGTYVTSSTLWDPIIAKYGAQGPKTYIYSGSGVDFNTYLQYRAPIRITNATNITVQNCLVQNSVSAGILIDAAAVNGTQEIIIRNNRVRLCWDNGIYFHKGVRNGSAIGNHCSDTQYSGITAIYCRDISTVGNICHDGGPSQSDSAAIEYAAVTDGLIADNLVYDSLFSGILLKNSDETGITGGEGNLYARNYNVKVTGNNVHDIQDPRFPSAIAAGIRVEGSSLCQINGNKVERANYGIDIPDDCSDILVQGNSVRRNNGWGMQIGNSPHIFNTQIIGNVIESNDSNGVTAHAPIIFKNNVVRDNNGQGVDLNAPPAGIPYKTDYIEENLFADNLYNGVNAAAGAGNLAIIRNNEFYNSDSLVFYDGVTTNGSTTFTSSTANFAASDVGASIVVLGAGSANGDSPLITTITAVTNSTTVTLAAAASASRTGRVFNLFRPKQVYYDGVMTSGNPTLTSATASFTSNDVGKTVLLYSDDGPNPSLLGTFNVASYTSGTQVDLNASPTNRTDILFVIKRNLGKQERALYISNNSDVHFIGNRSWCMRNENYPAGAFSESSVLLNNYDFGSNTSNQPITPSLALPIMSVNYDSYPGGKNGTVLVDASGANRNVYLPATSTVTAGTVFVIKKTDNSGNTVTIDTTGGQTIDGAATQTLNTQWQTIRVQSTGSAWVTI